MRLPNMGRFDTRLGCTLPADGMAVNRRHRTLGAAFLHGRIASDRPFGALFGRLVVV
jgi:hypothetical protein